MRKKTSIFTALILAVLAVTIGCNVDSSNNGTNRPNDNLPDGFERSTRWEENFEAHAAGANLNALPVAQRWAGTVFPHNTWSFTVVQGNIAGNNGRFAELISENNSDATRAFGLIRGRFVFDFDFLMRSTDTSTGNLQLILQNMDHNVPGQAGRPIHLQINGNGAGSARTFNVTINGDEANSITDLPVDVWHRFRIEGNVRTRTFDLSVGSNPDNVRTGLVIRHVGPAEENILGAGLNGFRIISSNTSAANPNRVLFDNFRTYEVVPVGLLPMPPFPSRAGTNPYWQRLDVDIAEGIMTQRVFTDPVRYRMFVPPEMIDGVLYLPLNTIVEYIGGRVDRGRAVGGNHTTEHDVFARILHTTWGFDVGGDRVTIYRRDNTNNTTRTVKDFAVVNDIVSPHRSREVRNPVIDRYEVMVPVCFFLDTVNFTRYAGTSRPGVFFIWNDELEGQFTIGVPSPNILSGEGGRVTSGQIPNRFNAVGAMPDAAAFRFFVSADSQGLRGSPDGYIEWLVRHIGLNAEQQARVNAIRGSGSINDQDRRIADEILNPILTDGILPPNPTPANLTYLLNPEVSDYVLRNLRSLRDAHPLENPATMAANQAWPGIDPPSGGVQWRGNADDGVSVQMSWVLDEMRRAMDSGTPISGIFNIGDTIAGAHFHTDRVGRGALDTPRTRYLGVPVSKWQFENTLRRFLYAGICFDTYYFPIIGNHDVVANYANQRAFGEKFDFMHTRPNMVFAPGFHHTLWHATFPVPGVGYARVWGLLSHNYVGTGNVTNAGHTNIITGPQFNWIQEQIALTNANPSITHNFFMSHSGYFSAWKFMEGQDRFVYERNRMWKLIESTRNPMVFAGHEHIFSRRLVDESFAEDLILADGSIMKFRPTKEIWHVITGGFGGGTNGEFTSIKNVQNYPYVKGIRHFVDVGIMPNGDVHVRAIAAEHRPGMNISRGQVFDEFIQVRQDF